MNLKLEQISAQLERGLAPIYLIGGPEVVLVQECRDLVLDFAKKSGFEERQVLDVDRQFDWDNLTAAGSAPSLFASKKVIDLRMSTGKPGQAGAKALMAYAAEPDSELLLIVSCDQWDKGSRTSKWAKTLEAAGVQVDNWAVKPTQLPGWIHNRMRRFGLEPDREAVLMLAERLEGNLLAARQEIEKISLLKGSGAVTAQDVEKSVADSSRFDGFLLAERILAGQITEGLRIAGALHRMGTPLQLVMGALFREFSTLEAFRLAMESGQPEQAAFRRLNVWSSRQGPMRAAARRLDDQTMNHVFQKLALIDQQSKGMANGNPWHSLDRLVCMMCAA